MWKGAWLSSLSWQLFSAYRSLSCLWIHEINWRHGNMLRDWTMATNLVKDPLLKGDFNKPAPSLRSFFSQHEPVEEKQQTQMNLLLLVFNSFCFSSVKMSLWHWKETMEDCYCHELQLIIWLINNDPLCAKTHNLTHYHIVLPCFMGPLKMGWNAQDQTVINSKMYLL